MKLHRAARKPEWARISQQQRNLWQRLAASTKGVVTWGNLLTFVGFVLVVVGLVALIQQRYWLGTWILFVSRLCDIADGWVAELTGTKSPLGEALDAGFDKISVLLTVVVLLVCSIIPVWVVLALVAPHLVIAGIAVKAIRRGRRLHPSGLGKISMTLGWFTLGGFVLMKALELGMTSVFAWAMYVLTICSVVAGLRAAFGYVRQRS
jgi:phosphatidylglycerophosphate synthase